MLDLRQRRRTLPGEGPPARARLAFRDLIGEALSGILERPLRSALTALGTVLAVGAFVATLGLTTTLGAQVSSRFDALKATEVTVQDALEDPLGPFPFPRDTEARLERLNGVRSAGVLWFVETDGATTRSSWIDSDDGARGEALEVAGASPGAFRALRITMRTGRPFDDFHDSRLERVAVLGPGAAQRLGVTGIRQQPAVVVAGVPFTVVGIIDDLSRRAELLGAVVVPAQTALDVFGPASEGPASVVIDTDAGAAQVVGRQAPLALRPDRPEAVTVRIPPNPEHLRRGVESDISLLLAGLAAVSLLIGTLGIANTTLVSVIERTGEIGLRRAVGAARRHIAGQFLAESALLGTLGGVVGTCVGVVAVGVLAASHEWSAVIDPVYVLLAPVVGTVAGLIAGAYPALKAALIEPVAALRR